MQERLMAVVLGVLLFGSVGCGPASSGSVASSLAASKQWSSPMVMNVCEEPPVNCETSMPFRKQGDEIGCYLRGDRHRLSTGDDVMSGPLLQALANAGYLELRRVGSGRGEKLLVSLTSKGERAAVTPVKSGCGFDGGEVGRPKWAIPLAEKTDVKVVTVETAGDGRRMQARVAWLWRATEAGRVVAQASKGLAALGSSAGVKAESREQLVKTAQGSWSLVERVNAGW